MTASDYLVVERLEAKVEELRTEIERLQGQIDTLRELRKFDRAEIERLRHDNMRLKTANDCAYDPRDGELSKLNREIVQLRAALDRAADALEFYDNKAEAQKARRAPEPKP